MDRLTEALGIKKTFLTKISSTSLHELAVAPRPGSAGAGRTPANFKEHLSAVGVYERFSAKISSTSLHNAFAR
jgi:hypothetical protein